jgi:hypothetical protein
VNTVRAALLLACVGLCGCTFYGRAQPESGPLDVDILSRYNRVTIGASTSADVLILLERPEDELLSQGKTVIASAGQKKDGHKLWFNLVAFDEDELTARHKCVLIADEAASGFLNMPNRRLDLRCQTILGEDIMGEPYASENARRMAVLRAIQTALRDDMLEVQGDNAVLEAGGMLAHQAIGELLVDLDKSPAVAADLSGADGMTFDHSVFGTGKAMLMIIGNRANLQIRIDASVMEAQDPFVIEQV